MFIEIAEYLRCPADHDEAMCVVAPDVWEGRRVVRGAVGCPSCGAEYPIADGVVDFAPGLATPVATDEPEPVDAGAVQALLDLATPGGVVVLAGTAGRLHRELAGRLGNTHLIAINPPPEVVPSTTTSVLRANRSLPVRSATVRGVVLGGECAAAPWLDEAGRITLRGLRLVTLAEVPGVDGFEQLAVGSRMWVGARTR